jgi:transposase InsO family protein
VAVALKVVTSVAEARLEVLLEPQRTGDSVAEVCRRRGISTQTFYEYRRRYLVEGLDGLEPRSRRPFHSPGQIDIDLEIEICRMRKDHKRWGARRIRTELLKAGIDPPAVSTIHQALRRNHLVADQPKKRRKFNKRFERPVPNDLWQIDGTEVKLQDGTEVWVADCLDDHARFLLDAHACESLTCDSAWACFSAASSRYGLPRQLLSDNGLCFTGRLHGFVVDFERKVESLGVEIVNSAPDHPQTIGKLERFHRTLKEFLEDEGPPKDLLHLQEMLDRFRHHYNEERPNQAIGDRTPAERYRPAAAAEPIVEDLTPPTYPPGALVRKVSRWGDFGYDAKRIQIGRRWAGTRVRVVPIGKLIHVYYGTTLIRSLALNPDRRYQGSGKQERR